MWQFASPYYFFLLLPTALAAWCVYRRRIKAGILFPASGRTLPRGPTWRTAAAGILPLLYLLGAVLAIVALARPQTVLSWARHSSNAIAIEMVVDVSGSMEALDMSTRTPTGVKYRTRLDAVKDAFSAFVDKRPDDLIGLVTFGGYASTRAPVTPDHEALLHVLQGVQIPRQSFDAKGQVLNEQELLTAIGDALATACARLEHVEPKTRVVVLLTDGDSNTGIIDPDEATQMAKRIGVKVYTIGVGSNGTAPFRGRDMFGREGIFEAQVTMDEGLLRRVAQATAGRYFNVRDPKGLDQTMEAIDKLEKTKVERDVYTEYHELFPWVLHPALLLIALGCGLNMMLLKRIV